MVRVACGLPPAIDGRKVESIGLGNFQESDPRVEFRFRFRDLESLFPGMASLSCTFAIRQSTHQCQAGQSRSAQHCKTIRPLNSRVCQTLVPPSSGVGDVVLMRLKRVKSNAWPPSTVDQLLSMCACHHLVCNISPRVLSFQKLGYDTDSICLLLYWARIV